MFFSRVTPQFALNSLFPFFITLCSIGVTSDFAMLTDASAPHTCDELPKDHMGALPPTCTVTVAGIRSKSFNVGRCNRLPCATRTSQVSARLCCLPSSTRQLQVDCAGFKYMINQVVSCSCVECANDNRVMVTGVVSAGGAPTSQVYILHNGARHSVPDHTLSFFSFEATPQAGRIVFQVMSSAFMPQLVTLDVGDGVTEMYVEITLTPKGIANVIDTSFGGQIDLVTPRMSSAVSVNIPSRSFQDKNGDPIYDDVNIYLSFSDPRLPDGLSGAPGQFTFEDSDGETRLLETRGVITMKAEDKGGNDIFLTGQVTLSFDADALGIESSDSFSLWSIDGATGDWKMSGELAYSGSGRRRRQATNNNKANTVVGLTEIPPNVPYLNCDKSILRGRLCSISVYVYYTDDFTTPLQGERLTAFMIENGLFIGQTQTYTDVNGKACLLVACGLQHIIRIESHQGVIVHQTHRLPGGFGFTNRANGFQFVANVGDSVNGPVFVNSGYRRGCSDLDSTAYHFKLARPELRPSLYGSLNAVEMRPGFDLSWYPKPPSKREICALQVVILVSKSSTNSCDYCVKITKWNAIALASIYSATFIMISCLHVTPVHI